MWAGNNNVIALSVCPLGSCVRSQVQLGTEANSVEYDYTEGTPTQLGLRASKEYPGHKVTSLIFECDTGDKLEIARIGATKVCRIVLNMKSHDTIILWSRINNDSEGSSKQKKPNGKAR